MKTIFYMKNKITITILLFILIIAGCENEKAQTLKFVSIAYGGCNDKSDLSEKKRAILNAESDTIIFEYKNDTLKVSVGINYICCSSFDATQTINNNEISLLITETTPSPDQYCKCECYYIFDYYFTNLNQKSYNIKVMFDSKDDGKDKSFSKTFNIN